MIQRLTHYDFKAISTVVVAVVLNMKVASKNFIHFPGNKKTKTSPYKYITTKNNHHVLSKVIFSFQRKKLKAWPQKIANSLWCNQL